MRVYSSSFGCLKKAFGSNHTALLKLVDFLSCCVRIFKKISATLLSPFQTTTCSIVIFWWRYIGLWKNLWSSSKSLWLSVNKLGSQLCHLKQVTSALPWLYIVIITVFFFVVFITKCHVVVPVSWKPAVLEVANRWSFILVPILLKIRRWIHCQKN